MLLDENKDYSDHKSHATVCIDGGDGLQFVEFLHTPNFKGYFKLDSVAYESYVEFVLDELTSKRLGCASKALLVAELEDPLVQVGVRQGMETTSDTDNSEESNPFALLLGKEMMEAAQVSSRVNDRYSHLKYLSRNEWF